MNSIRKKLVFITARLPYPASSGRKNVMYNYCKILHEVYGYEITILSFLESGDVIEPKPNFIHRVIELPNVSGKRKAINMLVKTLLLRKFPMQVSLFYDHKHQETIDLLIKEAKPDVVMTDMVRTSEYARNYKGYKIVNLDDMLSIRYRRQLDVDLATVNPYGAFLYSLPKSIIEVLSKKIMKKIILKNEIKLLYKYERDVAKDYDRTVFVAEREAEILNKDLNFTRAIAIPLGVDAEFYGRYYGKLQPQKYTIAFLGAMSVAHNESAAINFIQNILPLILNKIKDAKFIIVGGGVTDQLKRYATKHVEFTGRVEDVRTVVGACAVFVCPLTFGSGIKTKNLEAMAMGVPVVTTSIGAENIHARDGIDWLVADDYNEFANKVVKVLKDGRFRQELAANAYSFVKDNFTWRVATEKFGFMKSPSGNM
ncbi:MAG: glycosyltransferase [Anaerocolumna sp.]|jgi:glycosyltransferase involved in cell wall biosynthesis|nr:glycosyltransferase [Anaerocolumna sp.]